MTNVTIIGRFTKDPELKRTQSEKSVVSFLLAVDRGYGQNKQTDYFDCVAWDKTAETITAYCAKGDMVSLAGRLQTRNWEDKNGGKHKTTEVVAFEVKFLASPKRKEEKASDTDEGDLPF